MAPVRVPSLGLEWSASISTLAKAYGKTEDEMAMTAYALAEQIHVHSCLTRGIVNHQEARPDQHVSISMLMALAGRDWWMVRSAEIWPPSEPAVVEDPGFPTDDPALL